MIGGYGVAQACLAAASVRDLDIERTSVAIQGVGTMGGGAAWYLHEAGMRVVALADAERLPAHGEAIRARFEDLSAPEENR